MYKGRALMVIFITIMSMHDCNQFSNKAQDVSMASISLWVYGRGYKPLTVAR